MFTSAGSTSIIVHPRDRNASTYCSHCFKARVTSAGTRSRCDNSPRTRSGEGRRTRSRGTRRTYQLGYRTDLTREGAYSTTERHDVDGRLALSDPPHRRDPALTRHADHHPIEGVDLRR